MAPEDDQLRKDRTGENVYGIKKYIFRIHRGVGDRPVLTPQM